MNLDVLHLATCNALITRSDVDCTCGALTPEECAAISQADATCEHGRAAGHPCPHCLGVNSVNSVSTMDDDIQLISDALKLRCRRCGGAHLTVKNEEPIAGFPIISYTCRSCGLSSADKDVP